MATATASVRLLLAVTAPRKPASLATPTRREAATRRSSTAGRVAAVQPLPANPDTPRALAEAAPSAPAEAPPASAPLRLDAQTLRRALAGTRGNVRQMARESGTELDAPRPSRSELLSAAVTETAVPDCLAPNAGGSLLSIPLIAYGAIAGKCK